MASIGREFDAARDSLKAGQVEMAYLASPEFEEVADRISDARARVGLSFGSMAPRVTDKESAAYAQYMVEMGFNSPRLKSKDEAIAQLNDAIGSLEFERKHETSFVTGIDGEGEAEFIIPIRFVEKVQAYLFELMDAERKSIEAAKTSLQLGGGIGSGTDIRSGLKELEILWIKYNSPASQSQKEMKTAIKRFEAVNGPLPYPDVSVEHVRQFKDSLVQETANKAATKNKQWSMISSLFRVAMENNLLDNSPFEKVKLGFKPDAARRDIFTKADLKAVFLSASEDNWWIFRLALYTGARLGEICQLTKSDIKIVDGIQFILIQPSVDEGKSVKNSNSIRSIPIHRQILDDGFDDWLASRENAALFPLNSSVYSKRLNRILKGFGFGPSKVVHSFRHTFISAARMVMEEEWYQRLTGHRSQSVGRQYGDYQNLKGKIDLIKFGIETQ
jgi:integrase